MPRLNDDQRQAFARGRALALRRFSPAEGLGPTFNATFCVACHEKPAAGGSAGHYRDFQIVGTVREGGFELVGKNGVLTQFDAGTVRGATPEDATVFATRNPIPFFGVGLLALVEDDDIRAWEDPDDVDGDGISGRANFDHGELGRFGRKAQASRLEGFVRGPLFNHLGVTSEPLSPLWRGALEALIDLDASPIPTAFATLVAAQTATTEPTNDNDPVADPELGPQEIVDLLAYTTLLAAPALSVSDDPERDGGAVLFADIGCAACHRQTLRTPHGLIAPYTDLLLHDMGPELDDGLPLGLASASEFRTAPLWGVVAVGPYLHDGRAATLEQAIRWHGGEALATRKAYDALTAHERTRLLAFLASLGGKEQRSDGLLPPGEPLAADGALGGPHRALTSQEAQRFAVGRAFFDRDISALEGLGPQCNGDSCRACHFEPSIGGAGPAGVNVTRQAIVDPVDVVFAAPPSGTMLHRFATSGARPEPDEGVNFFEVRQTPSLFGLGLMDAIPDAAIEAGADPDDADMDGVSGRVHRLADGRLGRLGWKGSVPSVEEFVRDALGAELGLTVPEDASLTFGVTSDDDGIPDPEVSAADYEALVFYTTMLAAPPRVRADVAQETRGEALFAQSGCGACHTPHWETVAGTVISPYTDLLLHEVRPRGLGLEDGDAQMAELRTPPLWGVGATAPYLHHGRVSTLDEAIRGHGGEAMSARQAYEALSSSAMEDLTAFLRSL